ncbi:MAG: hypothetical protein ACRDOB_22550 [Streptosporangiaceae bacterium]
MTGMAGAADTWRNSMYAPNGSGTARQPVLMRILVRSWEYRHAQAWAGTRFACGAFNLGLAALLFSFGWALGAIPLIGAGLLFWTGHRLQLSVQS